MSNPIEDRVVDARWLSPPEPLELTIAALEELAPEQRVRLLIHRDPAMLYSILRDWGYAWQTETTADGTYEILIWYPANSASPAA